MNLSNVYDERELQGRVYLAFLENNISDFILEYYFLVLFWIFK